MRAALLQHPSPEGAVDAGLAVLADALRAAGAAGAAILTAPETFLPGYNIPDPTAFALSRNEVMALVAPLCGASGCGLVLGYAERDGAEVFNAAIATDARGDFLANYRKIQLYGTRENDIFTAGDRYAIFEVAGRKAAMLICYDVEFPGHIAALRRRGVDIVFTPTANMLPFTHVSRAVIPAHAASGAMTIVYANLCGAEGDLVYAGNSVIAGPHGEIIVMAGDGPALLVADVPPPGSAPMPDLASEFREGR